MDLYQFQQNMMNIIILIQCVTVNKVFMYIISINLAVKVLDIWDKKEEVISFGDNIFGNTETESKQSPEIGNKFM